MVKLYVEGGGDADALKRACRRGFSDFLGKAGVARKPRIVACGGRQNAYDLFRLAIENGEAALLLVDSEAPVNAKHQAGPKDAWLPWQHLKERPGDGWDKPSDAIDGHCHLMVQCMESWFLADVMTLAKFFGQGFQAKQLPPISGGVEGVTKTSVYRGLEAATRACRTKAPYGKGEHSFSILSLIDPAMVLSVSPWADRFVNGLKAAMDN